MLNNFFNWQLKFVLWLKRKWNIFYLKYRLEFCIDQAEFCRKEAGGKFIFRVYTNVKNISLSSRHLLRLFYLSFYRFEFVFPLNFPFNSVSLNGSARMPCKLRPFPTLWGYQNMYFHPCVWGGQVCKSQRPTYRDKACFFFCLTRAGWVF